MSTGQRKSPLSSTSSTDSGGASSDTAKEELPVPCDLYGLFVTEPLQLDVRVDGCLILLLVMVRAFFFIALNFTIQMLYVVRIHAIGKEFYGDQCKGTPHMQIVCCFVFSMSIFREMRSCIDFFALLVRAPVSGASGCMIIGEGSDSTGRHGAVLHEDSRTPASRLMSWMKRRVHLSKSHVWTLASMSNCWKLTCLLLVAVPRAIICALFAKVGSIFILRSQEEEIIIDTVAMLFVVDIGTFMYNAFTAAATKQQLERMKPLMWHPSNSQRFASFLFLNYAYPLLLITFSIVVVWDCRQACKDGEDLASALQGSEEDLAQMLQLMKEMMCLRCE